MILNRGKKEIDYRPQEYALLYPGYISEEERRASDKTRKTESSESIDHEILGDAAVLPARYYKGVIVTERERAVHSASDSV